MIEKKSELLTKTSILNDFIDIDFDELSKKDEFPTIVEGLIFLVGYNHIEVKNTSSNSIVFYAGIFPEDIDEKISIKDSEIDGKLLMAIKTAFNVLKDIKSQPDGLAFYPRKIIEENNNKILENNKIGPFFLSQIRSRII